MHVEDTLACVRPGVGDQPIAGVQHLQCCNLPREREHRRSVLGVCRELGRRDHVPLGHDQDMGRGLRVQVAEGQREVALRDHLRLDLPGHESTKEAVAHAPQPSRVNRFAVRRVLKGVTMSVVARPVTDLGSLSADQALEALYASHWTAMVRLAWLFVHDQGVAEDIVADALVRLHQRWGHLDDKDMAVGYLRRSVVNAARSVIRHRTVEANYLARAGTRAEATATAPSAEKLALDQVGNAAILRELDRLPRRQREVLVLRYYSDLSEAQIADTLGIAPGSVKAHAHRGLATLRATLTNPARSTGEET